MHDVEFIKLVLYVTLTLTNLYNRFVLMHDLTHNPPFTPKTGFVPKIRLLWESVPNLQSLAQPRTAQPQHVLIDYFAQTQNKNQKLALLNDQTPFTSKIKQIIWKDPISSLLPTIQFVSKPAIIYIPIHTLIITGSTYFRFFQQFPLNYFYDSDSNDNNIFMIFHIQDQQSNIICISNFYLQITKETKHKDTNITTEWSKSVWKCSIITSASFP